MFQLYYNTEARRNNEPILLFNRLPLSILLYYIYRDISIHLFIDNASENEKYMFYDRARKLLLFIMYFPEISRDQIKFGQIQFKIIILKLNQIKFKLKYQIRIKINQIQFKRNLLNLK